MGSLFKQAEVDLSVADDRQLAVSGVMRPGHGAGRVVGAQRVVADEEDDRGLGVGRDAVQQGEEVFVGVQIGPANALGRIVLEHHDVVGGALDERRGQADAAAARLDDDFRLLGRLAELLELGQQVLLQRLLCLDLFLDLGQAILVRFLVDGGDVDVGLHFLIVLQEGLLDEQEPLQFGLGPGQLFLCVVGVGLELFDAVLELLDLAQEIVELQEDAQEGKQGDGGSTLSFASGHGR